MVDDEDRENEGDFVTAAELITPEKVNFMITQGRGFCVLPFPKRAAKHSNSKQVSKKYFAGTPFTITVDLLKGCTTGVSAQDRAAHQGSPILPQTGRPGTPGHINPYTPKRKSTQTHGHTEALLICAVWLTSTGSRLIEIMNEDGSMARMPQLIGKNGLV